MKNKADQQKKAYEPPRIEVHEGFEKNVLASGCNFVPNIVAPCGWQTPSG